MSFVLYFLCTFLASFGNAFVYQFSHRPFFPSLSYLKASALSTSFDFSPLRNVTVCVTGASRGIGRGIALQLAELGAVVYVTGRSKNDQSITDLELGGSLSSLVSSFDKSNGGEIRPVVIDHGPAGDKQVQALIQQIQNERGSLDILVNNAFQLPTNPETNKADTNYLFKPFWELPGAFWDTIIDVGLRSHYVTTHHAAPLMIDSAKLSTLNPLIVHISSFGGTTYSFNAAYGVGKAAVDRLAKDMAFELKNTNVKCVSFYPGIVRTERMDTMLNNGEFDDRTGLYTVQRFVESPQLTGLAIAALYSASDRYVNAQNGRICVTAEIAKRYDIKDPKTNIIPPSIRSLKFLMPAVLLKGKKPTDVRQIEDFLVNNVPDALLPMSIMASGSPNS